MFTATNSKKIIYKTKTFFSIFGAISEIYINFWTFKKNMTLRSYIFQILKTAKDMVRRMSKNARFRKPFNSQHVKGSQTLPKSTQQDFYHIR